ncbi:hypothetical protein [Pseudomonas sp. LS-2]|uniref:hypothetical protein n=1 Tax=Pseudomonas sp. LS-2 TaxID=2315859 RepID=UPI000E70D801|nr:hypothetical protein [Pseudomonas sp. LS-2]RJX82261.1 hypothetical protein D3M70_06710 [Pseudomonas sp. LS-2]
MKTDPTDDADVADNPSSYQDLQNENRELRLILSQRVLEMSQVVEFISEFGMPAIRLQGGPAELIALAFAKQLAASNPENYLQLVFGADHGAEISVTLQRHLGLSPHHLRVQAQRDCEEQKQRCVLLSRALQRQRNDIPEDQPGTPAQTPSAEAVMNSPSTSAWLKLSLETALVRDSVDAASDAEVLADILGQRCEAELQASLAALSGR